MSSSDEEEVHCPRKKVCKPNASRAAKQREIDWLPKVKGVMIPVCQKQRDETQKVAVPKTYKKADINNLAKDEFFPVRTSSTHDIFTFKALDDSITVGQSYKASKLPLVRFYLV